MTDYTPTTEQVRNGWIDNGTHEERDGAEFDRWLAAHDAQVAAKALRDAADALDALTPETIPDDPRWTCDLGYHGEAEWLRDYAERPEGR